MTDLPPAIPPFRPDADTAYAELGKALAYIKQLSAVMLERAEEANRIDDDRLDALHRLDQLSRNLDEERERNRQLMAKLDAMKDEHDDQVRRLIGSD